MSLDIVLTALISVIITLFLAFFSLVIYKSTKGGSKAYYFWALSGILLLMGSLISFGSSFFMDPNAKNLEGIEGIIAVFLLSFYLAGYYYLSLGATYLPAQLNVINIDLDKLYKLRKLIFLGIICFGIFVIFLLLILDSKLPVRMFYVPFYVFIWLYCFFILLPFYKIVKDHAGYWIFILFAAICGFLGNLSEMMSYFILDDLIIFLPIFYAFMGFFAVYGFYHLGKDLDAF